MVSCVSPPLFPSFLEPVFLIVYQIIGIVYSAKLVPIDENLLYTRENHFTGSYPRYPSELRMHHDHTRQATRSSGVASLWASVTCFAVSPWASRARRQHWLMPRTLHCS